MTWIHLRLGIIAILCAAVYLIGGIAAPAMALACEGIAEEEKKEEEKEEALRGKLVPANAGVLQIKERAVGEESIEYQGGLEFSGQLSYAITRGPFSTKNPANNKCENPIKSLTSCRIAAECNGREREVGEVEVRSQRRTVKPAIKRLECIR